MQLSALERTEFYDKDDDDEEFDDADSEENLDKSNGGQSFLIASG